MSKKRNKAICVYCGSRMGISNEYSYNAKLLGQKIANNNFRLVYGGGNIGLMGILAESCHQNGGEILGIIPHKLSEVIDKKDFDLVRLSKLALDDPSTGGNPKKLNLNDMKIMYQHSMSGELFK